MEKISTSTTLANM